MFITRPSTSTKSHPSTHRRLMPLTLSRVRPPGYVSLGRFTSSSFVTLAGSVSVSIGAVCARSQFVRGVLLAMIASIRGQPFASTLVAVVLLTSSRRRNGISPSVKLPSELKPLSAVFAVCFSPPNMISSASCILLKSSKWNASDISERSIMLMRPV